MARARREVLLRAAAVGTARACACASAVALAACGVDTNGLDFFPDAAGTSDAPPLPPPVEAGVDTGVDAARIHDASGAYARSALAAAATVCSSPSYRAVVTLGQGSTDERAIKSPNYKVLGAVSGVAPK